MISSGRQPGRGEEAHDDGGEDGHAGNNGRVTLQRRVRDVPAIQLAEGQEVQRGREHPEPRGEDHGVGVEGLAVRNGAERHPRNESEEKRFAEGEAALDASGRGTTWDSAIPQTEHRQQGDEAGNRACDADVEQNRARSGTSPGS